MKREDFELHVAYLFYRTGGHMPPPQAYRSAREDARHGPPKLDLRHLRGFKEYMAKVDAAAEADTTDVPQAVVKKVAGAVGEKMLETLLGPRALKIMLGVFAVLAAIDQQDLLPVAWDDALEAALNVATMLGIYSASKLGPPLETKSERIEREKPGP